MKPSNSTEQAVIRQIDAMAVNSFDVGIYDASAEKMLIKTWDRDTVIRSIPYLQYENRRQRHIYIRPAGEHALTLLDDLTTTTLDRMRSEGFTPALVLETSPKNFQAWVNHGQVLPRALSSAAARSLAEKFDSDTSSADWRHFGRLAGFTNCKDKYRQSNGYFPFVKLHEAETKLYPAAPEFLKTVIHEFNQRQAEDIARKKSFSQMPVKSGTLKTITDFHNNPNYKGDGNRADLAYAVYAVARGVSPAEVEAALRSRDLTHKGGSARQNDYIDRTIKKAIEQSQGHSVRR